MGGITIYICQVGLEQPHQSGVTYSANQRRIESVQPGAKAAGFNLRNNGVRPRSCASYISDCECDWGQLSYDFLVRYDKDTNKKQGR